MNYYNEFDPFAAAWLRELIKAKLIPQGDVDERSITEVQSDDLKQYTQCHFFAGIGGWSYALQLAGWPTDRPVWTGSCPCQPFSSAGRQKGKADDRHLWPVWFGLIKECRPPTIFGEQVASAEIVGTQLETSFIVAVQSGDFAKANRIANKLVKTNGFGFTSRWLDDVYQGLEAEGYAVGAAVLPACSVGAPHKRDRLWFVGHAERNGSHESAVNRSIGSCQDQRRVQQPQGSNTSSNVATSDCTRSQGHGRPVEQHDAQGRQEQVRWDTEACVWIDCPDGKQRLIEPSIHLLAHGIPSRVGRLRAYGNAIVPQVASEMIAAFMDLRKDTSDEQ